MNLMGDCNTHGGYGLFTSEIFRALPGNIFPLRRVGIPEDLSRRFVRYENQEIDLQIAPLCDNIKPSRVLFTMWEADDIPYGHVLSSFEHLIVPTEFDANVFRKYFNGSIQVCPLGIDGRYSPPRMDVFQFTFVGADHGIPERKRAQWVIDEFVKMFRTQDDVRLVMIVDKGSCATSFDRRVSILKNVSDERYDEVLQNTSVGIVPGGMEGWSFPAHQFIATGKPVLAPLWGGITGILNEDCAFPLDYFLVPVPDGPAYKGRGNRAWAQDLGLTMAQAYHNRLDVIQKGLAGFYRAKDFTVEKMLERFKKCLLNTTLFQVR